MAPPGSRTFTAPRSSRSRETVVWVASMPCSARSATSWVWLPEGATASGGAGDAVADVGPGEQSAMLYQVKPVQRGESAAPGPAPQGARRPPEHREPLVQLGSAGPHRVADRAKRDPVFQPGRIREHQPDVDVADQRAEPAMRQAAERVGGDKAGPEGRLKGGDRLGEHRLALLARLITHGRPP